MSAGRPERKETNIEEQHNKTPWRIERTREEAKILLLELNRLYNMDCIAGMKQFPDNYFDLAIVDPPYGLNATKMDMGSNSGREGTAKKLRKGRLQSGGGKLKDCTLLKYPTDWDASIPPPEYFQELFRVSCHQVIFGGNYFPLPPTRGIGIWDKKQPWKSFSQFELIWTSYDCPAFIIAYSFAGGANKEEKINATQKPLEVYNQILNKFAKPGYKLLETHAGSAPLFITGRKQGYDVIAFETDSEMYERAQKRIEAHLTDPRWVV